MEPTNTDYQLNSRMEAEKQRFTDLMSLSDEQLRIRNSNERVDFKGDEIYSDKSPGIVSLLRERKLNETEYYNLV